MYDIRQTFNNVSMLYRRKIYLRAFIYNYSECTLHYLKRLKTRRTLMRHYRRKGKSRFSRNIILQARSRNISGINGPIELKFYTHTK